MYTKIIKSKDNTSFFEWITKNNYSISSPRHRGFYAEMIFKKYCKEKGIFAVKVNPYIDVLEQIDVNFLKKIQQKELEKLGKIPLFWFCMELGTGYFVTLKMGTSAISKNANMTIKNMKKNNVFEFRVYEDSDIFIRKRS